MSQMYEYTKYSRSCNLFNFKIVVAFLHTQTYTQDLPGLNEPELNKFYNSASIIRPKISINFEVTKA